MLNDEIEEETGMIAVIFEIEVDPGRGERYFDLAATLREELGQAEGFFAVERFKSLNTENKFVPLSFWRDREAVEAWYQRQNHRAAQEAGRRAIFRDYRIRVSEVFRDYDMKSGRRKAG